jgi:hypothetical protein
MTRAGNRLHLSSGSFFAYQLTVCRHGRLFRSAFAYLSLIPSQLLFKSFPGLSEGRIGW